MRAVIRRMDTIEAGLVCRSAATGRTIALLVVGSLALTGCADKRSSLEGKEFATLDGDGIKFRANGEAEVIEHQHNFVGKYTVEKDGRIRVVVTTLGTAQATYYKVSKDGLESEDGTVLQPRAAVEAERQKRQVSASCDELLHSLDGELANELDSALFGGRADCGCKEAACVIACTLNKHKDETNPRNKTQTAFIGSGSPSPCQVLLSLYTDSRGKGTGVEIRQVPAPGAVMWSFNITMD